MTERKDRTLECRMLSASLRGEAEILRRFVRAADLKANSHVLDLGCGTGPSLVALQALTEGEPPWAVGMDLSWEHVATTPERIRPHLRRPARVAWVQADGHRLPFADNSFAVVIFRGVLPSMRADFALRESHRVLCSGGWCFLEVMGVGQLALAVRRRPTPGTALRAAFALMNGLLFHFTERQAHLGSFCDFYQTPSSLRAFLERIGFQVEWSERRPVFYFVVRKKTAEK